MNMQYLPAIGCEKADEDWAQATAVTRIEDFLRRRLDALRKYRELRKEWRIDRQAFQNVLYLDDRILEDMGVTREDVLWANKLPLSRNAALELRKISRAKCHAVHRRAAKKIPVAERVTGGANWYIR